MNCQPIKDILRNHKIDCYALHTSTTRKNNFRNISFLVCYTTRPQWSPFKLEDKSCFTELLSHCIPFRRLAAAVQSTFLCKSHYQHFNCIRSPALMLKNTFYLTRHISTIVQLQQCFNSIF